MEYISYSDFSFDSIVKNLQGQLSKKESWTDAYRSSTGQTLIELFAYVGDIMHYTQERAIQESFLTLASLESSVVRNAKLFGYEIKRNTSARCTVRFSIPVGSTWAYPILIPRGTVVKSEDGKYKYIVEEDNSLDSGTYIDVECVEGVLYKTQFISTGVQNQGVTLENTFIENDGVRLYVSSGSYVEPWRRVSALVPTAHVTNGTSYYKAYEVNELPNKYLLVKLGDNTFGKIPETGDTVKIEYLVSTGVLGNISSIDTLVVVDSPIKDNNGADVDDIECTNIVEATGGVNRESIDSIKSNAPVVFQTGQRAVTKLDHAAILKAIDPSVDKIYIESERDVNPPNYNMFNKINIYLLRTLDGEGNPQPVTDAWVYGPPEGSLDRPLKGTLLGNLMDYAMLTTKYTVTEGTIIKYDIELNAYCMTGQDITVAKTNVETVLREVYGYENATLGTPIVKSTVTSSANTAEGVVYTEANIRLYDEISHNGTVSSNTLSLTPIAKNNFGLYIDNVLVAVDNGVGGLSAVETTYNLATGSVNYTTGVISDISFNTAPTTANVLAAKYKQGISSYKYIRSGDINATDMIGSTKIQDVLTEKPIVPGSFRVKIDGVSILEDDFSGNIIESSTHGDYDMVIASTNTIDYNTGSLETWVTYLGAYSIPLDKSILLEYDRNAPNENIVVNAYQCAVLNSIVTTIRYVGA